MPLPLSPPTSPSPTPPPTPRQCAREQEVAQTALRLLLAKARRGPTEPVWLRELEDILYTSLAATTPPPGQGGAGGGQETTPPPGAHLQMHRVRRRAQTAWEADVGDMDSVISSVSTHRRPKREPSSTTTARRRAAVGDTPPLTRSPVPGVTTPPATAGPVGEGAMAGKGGVGLRAGGGVSVLIPPAPRSSSTTTPSPLGPLSKTGKSSAYQADSVGPGRQPPPVTPPPSVPGFGGGGGHQTGPTTLFPEKREREEAHHPHPRGPPHWQWGG